VRSSISSSAPSVVASVALALVARVASPPAKAEPKGECRCICMPRECYEGRRHCTPSAGSARSTTRNSRTPKLVSPDADSRARITSPTFQADSMACSNTASFPMSKMFLRLFRRQRRVRPTLARSGTPTASRPKNMSRAARRRLAVSTRGLSPLCISTVYGLRACGDHVGVRGFRVVAYVRSRSEGDT